MLHRAAVCCACSSQVPPHSCVCFMPRTFRHTSSIAIDRCAYESPGMAHALSLLTCVDATHILCSRAWDVSSSSPQPSNSLLSQPHRNLFSYRIVAPPPPQRKPSMHPPSAGGNAFSVAWCCLVRSSTSALPGRVLHKHTPVHFHRGFGHATT